VLYTEELSVVKTGTESSIERNWVLNRKEMSVVQTGTDCCIEKN
jgi:hypothetical protein